MEEIYRICKKGGEVVVEQPYFRSVWGHIDPRVKSFGTVLSFDFYDPDNPICSRYRYSTARYHTKNVYLDHDLDDTGLIKKFIRSLENRWPKKYESYFSHIFILDKITYLLIKL